LTAIAL